MKRDSLYQKEADGWGVQTMTHGLHAHMTSADDRLAGRLADGPGVSSAGCGLCG